MNFRFCTSALFVLVIAFGVSSGLRCHVCDYTSGLGSDRSCDDTSLPGASKFVEECDKLQHSFVYCQTLRGTRKNSNTEKIERKCLQSHVQLNEGCEDKLLPEEWTGYMKSCICHRDECKNAVNSSYNFGFIQMCLPLLGFLIISKRL